MAEDFKLNLFEIESEYERAAQLQYQNNKEVFEKLKQENAQLENALLQADEQFNSFQED